MKAKLLKIGSVNVSGAKGYVFDGCHKIYVCRRWKDVKNCREDCDVVHNMNTLEWTFKKSCPLRFINWLDNLETIVPQCANKVKFCYSDGTTSTVKFDTK